MKFIEVAKDGIRAAENALKRTPLTDDPEIQGTVRDIIGDVKERGDTALLELGQRFDSPRLSSISVSEMEWDSAIHQAAPESRHALDRAAENITRFHERQLRSSWMDTRSGIVTGQVIRPLNRVGIYVPGGTAVYPSTVLMVGIPARVAGVNERIMCTPCRSDGSIHPLVLYAAKLAGIQRIYKVGGAQAIGAMAFGTESIPVVDKIAGPGNMFVTAAKKQVYGVVDIDMLAGPSEVCVVADEDASSAFAAADLITQTEHDTESVGFLMTPSLDFARRVQSEVQSQVERLPRRAIVQEALERNGAIIVTESVNQAIELANLCAPEHLALMVRNPFAWLGCVTNAGAILLGDYSPQTLGDYMAGPSHTLPTGGTARFASPLQVDTFLKKSSVIYYTREALAEVAPALEQFATAEGFEAHRADVAQRFLDQE